MENKKINIGVVKKIALALKHIRPNVAFVGGAIISLYTDDPAADELRPTKDIDLSLTIESYGAWARLQEELALLGFQPDQYSKLICRFIYEDVTVDIMPDDEKILGFSNPWYRPALQKVQSFHLPKGPEIISSTSLFSCAKVFSIPRSGPRKSHYQS